MALVQAINTTQIQSAIDDFAKRFLELEARAEELVGLAAELGNAANVSLVKGDDGTAMTSAINTELQARLNALQSFVTYATTGNPSPVKYLRGVKRVV